MSNDKHLQLTILTQEREILTQQVSSVTVPTSEGEVTILPGHIPLFSKLDIGELVYRWKEGSGDRLQEDSLAVSGGFLDVNPAGEVTILADHAIRSTDIDLAQAEEARRQAELAMENRQSEQDFRLAEASLKRALNDLKIAGRRRSSGGTPRL